MGRMRIRITSVDYAPPELEAQTPIDAELLKAIPGPDRADYWIAAVTKPIRWVRDRTELSVTHIIVTARWQGTQIGPGMQQLPIGIAYVVDESVLGDSSLDLKKCAYVAIGIGEELRSTF